MLNNSTIFQTKIWEQFQNTLPGRIAGHITRKQKDLIWTIIPSVLKKKYLYINHGPVGGNLIEYWQDILGVAKENQCTYIKVEPLALVSDVSARFAQLKLKPSNYHIQPSSTLILNLNLSTEELLKQMKPKGRYNIKIAAKYCITYQEFDGTSPTLEAGLDQFYHLLDSTATRDHFGIHSREYYKLFLAKLFPHSRLYLAYHGNKVVAGLIALFYQDESIYYYGASSNQDRETMATYGLQWHVIQAAKKYGAKTYDFLGIAPENASPSHPWQGVTSFKKKFGGEVVEYIGTFHYVIDPLAYFLIHAPKKILNYCFRR